MEGQQTDTISALAWIEATRVRFASERCKDSQTIMDLQKAFQATLMQMRQVANDMRSLSEHNAQLVATCSALVASHPIYLLAMAAAKRYPPKGGRSEAKKD
jgi:hypothetical protein